MAAPSRRREDPSPGGSGSAHFQKRCGSVRQWNDPSSVLRLAKRNVNRSVAHVIPFKAETLFWSQAAIDKHGCDIAQEKWVLRLYRLLASLNCPGAFERTLV